MGVTPNPGSKQRDRHYQWTILPPTGPTNPPPKLAGVFNPRAHELWAYWWTTPMATMWGKFDAPALERLLELYEQTWEPVFDDAGNKKPTPASVLSEVRQMEDRYGLNPAGRRKLFWQVEGVDIPAVGEKVSPVESGRRSAPKAGSAADPRAALRAIDGGKQAG